MSQQPPPELRHAGIAINRYVSSPLRGCLTDLANMVELLGQYGYVSETIRDEEATAAGIVQFLREQVAKVGPNTKLVITNSGHGAQGPSRTEADRTNECWVGQDMRPVWDDQIGEILSAVDPAGQITVISDSCHSATVTRAVALGVESAGDGYRAARTIPLEQLADPVMDPTKAAKLVEDGSTPRSTLASVLAPEPEARRNTQPPVWLFAACQAQQVTYDAFINGVAQGCYTRALIDALGDLLATHQQTDKYEAWQPTNAQLQKAVRRKLPSEDYDNIPWAGGVGARSLVFAVDARR